jgi:hypothetical protein
MLGGNGSKRKAAFANNLFIKYTVHGQSVLSVTSVASDAQRGLAVSASTKLSLHLIAFATTSGAAVLTADPAAKTAMEQGDRLANRLNDHRKNIAKAETTLRLEDFDYRAIVVQTGWQTAAEDYLIHLFKPIWNSEVGISYGFGKHGDDPGTRANLRSPWDTLHPGRDWAHRDPKMKDARSKQRIVEDIRQHLAKYPPLGTIDQILRKFLEEMRAVS